MTQLATAANSHRCNGPKRVKGKNGLQFFDKKGNSNQNGCCGRKERDDVSITIMGWSNAVHRNNLRILHNSCSDGAQRLSVLVCLTTFNAVTAAIHDCGDIEFQGANCCRVWILQLWIEENIFPFFWLQKTIWKWTEKISLSQLLLQWDIKVLWCFSAAF